MTDTDKLEKAILAVTVLEYLSNSDPIKYGEALRASKDALKRVVTTFLLTTTGTGGIEMP